MFLTRYSARSTIRPNRLLNINSADELLDIYSIYPKEFNRDQMLALLMNVQCDVSGMKPSDRDSSISSKVAYHSSSTIKQFDNSLISNQMQHMKDLSCSELTDPMVNFKRNDETLIVPRPQSFKELELLASKDNSGVAICCCPTYSSILTYPHGTNICKDTFIYRDSVIQTDILTYGGFVTPLHTDIGSTNRFHTIVTKGCVKLWIFLRTSGKEDCDALHVLIASWKTSTTTSEKVDLHKQIEYIISHQDKFDFVIQKTNQEMQHAGAYPHMVITMINPTVNPGSYCLSVGFRIINVLSMVNLAHDALITNAKGLFWQQSNGYLKPILKSGKSSIKDVEKATEQFISTNIKNLGGARTPTDIARAKTEIMKAAKQRNEIKIARVHKAIQFKTDKKQMKNKKLSNLLNHKSK